MYEKTTHDVRVEVEPFYLEDRSEPEASRYVFGYRIRIENRREDAVRLVARHWRITDGFGRLTEVRGEGVVGEKPLLKPGGSFAYASGTPLATPSGFMTGSYRLVTSDGDALEVAIPTFALDVPGAAGRAN